MSGKPKSLDDIGREVVIDLAKAMRLDRLVNRINTLLTERRGK